MPKLDNAFFFFKKNEHLKKKTAEKNLMVVSQNMFKCKDSVKENLDTHMTKHET